MILLIDNYDSFTYNLLHYIGETGSEICVKRNDELEIADVLAGFKARHISGLVISPGPSSPAEAGISVELVKALSSAEFGDYGAYDAVSAPILGVCLGHQAIVAAFGGNITQLDKPVHGKVSDILHNGTGIFADIPSPFVATRYHSLIAEKQSFPYDQLQETAIIKESQVIMGVQHKSKPIYGVQFHPESIASEHGHKMIENFTKICART